MWSEQSPILTSWEAGLIRLDEVLYEFDGPTIFTAYIGLSKFILFKKDELEESDVFLACPTSDDEVDLLKNGKISIRGILSDKAAWLLETDLDLNVLKFQTGSASDVQHLLPPRGIALLSKFGVVPDSIGQAQAFMAFKFTGQVLSSKSMPLSVFKGLIDGVSNLVRQALIPSALMRGRDTRFFDVQIGQPQFASLLVTIESADIDEKGMRDSKRTRNLVPQALLQDTEKKGLEFWNSIEQTTLLASKDELTPAISEQYHDMLNQIAKILPSEDNDLDRLEVTFHGSTTSKVVSIDKKSGDRLIRAHQYDKVVSKVVSGSITEINGEARTFIIKDRDRLTTCAPSVQIFEQMDKAGIVERGIRLKLEGKFWRRPRRDYLAVDKFPEVLK